MSTPSLLKTKKNSSEYSLETRLMYKFLKKNRCLKEYVDNIIEQHPPKYNVKTGRYVKTKDILKLIEDHENSIDFSFTWSSTPQGHYYWSKLNAELQNLIYYYCYG